MNVCISALPYTYAESFSRLNYWPLRKSNVGFSICLEAVPNMNSLHVGKPSVWDNVVDAQHVSHTMTEDSPDDLHSPSDWST